MPINKRDIIRTKNTAKMLFNAEFGTNYKCDPIYSRNEKLRVGAIIGSIMMAAAILLYMIVLNHTNHVLHNEITLLNKEMIVISNTKIANFHIKKLNDPSVEPASGTQREIPRSHGVLVKLPVDISEISSPMQMVSFPVSPYSKKEMGCLTEAIYHEANPKPFSGRIAVGEVILNRVFSKSWPNTICGVISQGDTNSGAACQFSYRCDGISDAMSNTRRHDESKIAAYTAIVNGTDITNGSVFYHATYVFPSWRKSMHIQLKVGNQIFYTRKQDTLSEMQKIIPTASKMLDHWVYTYMFE